ncbi:MAG: Succinyl-CoA ligase [ADP-forming] beta chain (EC [uncultured Campylobacterales bacterium]|uniref:Succinate--CoA ligase [ADP-forming] subunit beta n=1 Tax=uncultured Campylobacterales bacterium TaxID=352960 RepID=A0A6S6T5B4_9BACT|nr:MAG: Succinyl-CoA ligase [ADP-forming] beta chain (EC [uncultured Campylobacterales bacterium]
MNIHEYQAKELFVKYKVPTTIGGVANNTEEALKVAKEVIGENGPWVVKAQIHAGGRGKAGGVKFLTDIKKVESFTQDLLGKTLVTHQTGPEGKVVKKVYVQEGIDIEKEFYLGIVLDRQNEMPVMMASTEGGVEIEEVAEATPEKIIKINIDPAIGFQGFHGRELAFGLGLPKSDINTFIKFASALYTMYMDLDTEMIEINPLVQTPDNRFVALDAKVGFDDNALYRHKDIEALRDLGEEEPTETEAAEYGLSYIKLDGSVGCMVNGAGLAMGTMDTINYVGGTPANFLDVGGSASAQTVAKGFEIILKDKNVKSIFVNIFGGIVRCDRVANGIIEATKITKINVPVIVRLDGTNAKEAAEILNNAGISNIITATDLADGAKKAVAHAK